MDKELVMTKEQILQMIDNYLRWIEIGQEQLKHIQVGIDMAANNVRTLLGKLKDVA